MTKKSNPEEFDPEKLILEEQPLLRRLLPQKQYHQIIQELHHLKRKGPGKHFTKLNQKLDEKMGRLNGLFQRLSQTTEIHRSRKTRFFEKEQMRRSFFDRLLQKKPDFNTKHAMPIPDKKDQAPSMPTAKQKASKPPAPSSHKKPSSKPSSKPSQYQAVDVALDYLSPEQLSEASTISVDTNNEPLKTHTAQSVDLDLSSKVSKSAKVTQSTEPIKETSVSSNMGSDKSKRTASKQADQDLASSAKSKPSDVSDHAAYTQRVPDMQNPQHQGQIDIQPDDGVLPDSLRIDLD